MLFRFREAQAADLGIIDAGRGRRPKLITSVTAIPQLREMAGPGPERDLAQGVEDPGPESQRLHDTRSK